MARNGQRGRVEAGLQILARSGKKKKGRMAEIAGQRRTHVVDQLVRRKMSDGSGQPQVVIAGRHADCRNRPRDGRLRLIGQPPDGRRLEETSSIGFAIILRPTHLAMTVVCVRISGGRACRRLTKSEVAYCRCRKTFWNGTLRRKNSRAKGRSYAIPGAAAFRLACNRQTDQRDRPAAGGVAFAFEDCRST